MSDSDADLCSFARKVNGTKAMPRLNKKGMAMGLFVEAPADIMAGLTLGIASATATGVAKLEIEQFFALPLAGKVVAGPCMMAMPPCVLYRVLGPRSRTGERQKL